MSGPQDARGAQAAARFLNPRSVAIVGISTRQGSAGQIILQCLKVNGFKGDVHLVGRTDEPIDGRTVLKSADELPEGVDLAVFALPAAAVREAVEACARRKVGSALVFAAGFAETGDYATQDAVAATARAAGLAICGPNCLGITNNVEGVFLHMLYARPALPARADIPTIATERGRRNRATAFGPRASCGPLICRAGTRGDACRPRADASTASPSCRPSAPRPCS